MLRRLALTFVACSLSAATVLAGPLAEEFARTECGITKAEAEVMVRREIGLKIESIERHFWGMGREDKTSMLNNTGELQLICGQGERWSSPEEIIIQYFVSEGDDICRLQFSTVSKAKGAPEAVQYDFLRCDGV